MSCSKTFWGSGRSSARDARERHGPTAARRRVRPVGVTETTASNPSAPIHRPGFARPLYNLAPPSIVFQANAPSFPELSYGQSEPHYDSSVLDDIAQSVIKASTTRIKLAVQYEKHFTMCSRIPLIFVRPLSSLVRTVEDAQTVVNYGGGTSEEVG